MSNRKEITMRSLQDAGFTALPTMSKRDMVEAALAYTEARAQKIAELDEEIGLVGEQVDEWAGCLGVPELLYFAAWTRTLSRLQAQRDTLTRGWRGGK